MIPLPLAEQHYDPQFRPNVDLRHKKNRATPQHPHGAPENTPLMDSFTPEFVDQIKQTESFQAHIMLTGLVVFMCK